MDNNRAHPRIKVTKDGPYLVSGFLPLASEIVVIGPDGEPEKWRRGPDYRTPSVYALCRCGASKRKPFCDGTHSAVGFDGTETSEIACREDQKDVTAGPGLDLIWAPKICAAARFCHAAGDAWNLTEKSDSPESLETAVREACNCPSGSLVARDKKTGRPIEPELSPSLSLIENPETGISGPLWVKGGIPIESADGRVYEIRNRVTLCRCGASKNKPFCDGAHIALAFDARR